MDEDCDVDSRVLLGYEDCDNGSVPLGYEDCDKDDVIFGWMKIVMLTHVCSLQIAKAGPGIPTRSEL